MEKVTNPIIRIFEDQTIVSRIEFIRKFFIDPNNVTDFQKWNRAADQLENLAALITVNITYMDLRF